MQRALFLGAGREQNHVSDIKESSKAVEVVQAREDDFHSLEMHCK